MNALREWMNARPWIAWLLVLLLGLVVVWQFTRGGDADDPYNLGRLSQSVTIKYDDGSEETLPLGRLEKRLWESPERIDLSRGILKPGTTNVRGFPVNDLKEMEDRINRLKAEDEARRRATKPPPVRPPQ